MKAPMLYRPWHTPMFLPLAPIEGFALLRRDGLAVPVAGPAYNAADGTPDDAPDDAAADYYPDEEMDIHRYNAAEAR